MAGFFRHRWWVVFASICGLIVGSGAINVFAFGVFLKPVTQSLGINREVFSSALIFTSTLIALGCLPLGAMLDRWGLRRVMIPGILLYALGTAAYALMSPSILVLYAVFAVAGLFGSIGTPVPYGAALSLWFDKQRGLAIGIAMAGVGLGVALVPQLAAFLIRSFGWRLAYVGLGLAIFIIAWLPVALFVREPTARDRAKQSDVSVVDENLPGITATEAIKGSWRFWALTIGFFLAIVAINGTLTQIVALLTDRGVPLQEATGALSAAGIALLLGRVLSGWFLDRFFGPYVAIGFFVIPMIGIALLASNASTGVSLLGAVFCGLGVGAEVDLMAFFVSRYFGLKAYGKIYGTMFAVFAFAQGIGATIAAASYDHYHTYVPAFMLFEAALLVTCLLLLPLGPYRYPARGRMTATRTSELPV